jgi:hypothetical protein
MKMAEKSKIDNVRRGNFGPKNGFWKGGKSIASNGYVLIRVGVNHHLSDVRGYAYEHRLVAEQKIGRRLINGEIVHHKNGDKKDNRPCNLEVVTGNWDHYVKHRSRTDLRFPDEENPIVECECGCGETFRKYDAGNRPRRFVSGHNMHPKSREEQCSQQKLNI